MPSKKRRRRPAGQAAPQRSTQGQARQRPTVPAGSSQRVEDSVFYEHPPRVRREDNLVEFPSGRTRPSQRQGGQRPQGRPRTQSTARQQGGTRRPAQVRPVQSVPRRESRRRRRVTRRMLRRRRMMRRLTAVFLVLCVAAAGIYLTVTMLFKINAIRVSGPDGVTVNEAGPYTSTEILDALGIQLEENIFSFDPAEKAAMLEKTFPLLEQIEVKRVYPSTVVVRVTPAEPAYAIKTRTGWISLSASLKILTAETEQPDLPVLYGGDPVSVVPGDQLAYKLADPALNGADSAASGSETVVAQDGRVEALQTLLDALESRGLMEDVTRIEYADVEQIAFLYQDRISVLLGTLNELDYKLDYAEYMLLNKEGKGCAETDTGQLDCSHVKSDGTLQAIFAQGVPELPSGYVAPEKVSGAEEETGQTDLIQTDGTAADQQEEETPADPAGETDLAGQTTDTGTAEPAAENQADEQAADAPAEGQTDEE